MTGHCPCCGQVLPPDLALVGHQATIYRALRRGALTTDEIVEAMYRGTRGPPKTAVTVFHVMVAALNRKLAPFGVAVRSTLAGGRRRLNGYGNTEGNGYCGLYRIVALQTLQNGPPASIASRPAVFPRVRYLD